MAYRQTYISLLTLLAGIVSSCSSDASSEEALVQGSAVTFEVSNETRASVTSTSDINSAGSRFIVFGDMKFPEGSNKDLLVLLNNAVVEYKNGRWVYDGTRYWIHECEHSFVAIHPASVIETHEAEYSNSKVSFTYEIPSTGDDNVSKEAVTDIVAATHRRHYHSDDPVNAVSFRFGHLLSLINLAAVFDDNVMDEAAHIEFHELELSRFNKKAYFELIPSALQSNRETDDRDINVTSQSGVGNMTVKFATPIKVENNRTSVKLFADNDAIVMLPQTFSSASEAKIVLTYTINGDPARKRVTLPLKNVEWAIGKSYTYRFTINRKGLVVTNTVISDWDKMDAGNFDVH